MKNSKKAKEILNHMIVTVHEQYFGNGNHKKDMHYNSIDMEEVNDE